MDSTTASITMKLPEVKEKVRYVWELWLPEIMAAKRGGNSGNYGRSLIEQTEVFCVKC